MLVEGKWVIDFCLTLCLSCKAYSVLIILFRYFCTKFKSHSMYTKFGPFFIFWRSFGIFLFNFQMKSITSFLSNLYKYNSHVFHSDINMSYDLRQKDLIYNSLLNSSNRNDLKFLIILITHEI